MLPSESSRPNTDIEEGIATSPHFSMLSAVDVDGGIFDSDFLATLATQIHEPSAVSVSTNQTSSVTPPIAATGLENIEQGSDGPFEIEKNFNLPTPTTAGCEMIQINDNDNGSQATQGTNNADFEISSDNIVPTQVDEFEPEVGLVAISRGEGEVEEGGAVQTIVENVGITMIPEENNTDDFTQFSQAVANIARNANTSNVYHLHAVIHDAVLVELSNDDDVIIATHFEPTFPWWKVRRVQLMLSALLLFAAANVIIVLFLLSGTGNNEPLNAAAPSPSSADLASLRSNHSSISSHPFTPKSCTAQVTSHAQKIKIRLENPRHPRIAVDGSNMVMVVGDGYSTSSQVVIFYSLMNNGTWLEVSSFHMENVGTPDASVALSGQTAFVGFGDANNFGGVVIVFEQNEFGSWKQVNDPFVRTTIDDSRRGFGLHHVAIDGEFSCVLDHNDCALGVVVESCSHNVNIFHRVRKRWVEFDLITGKYCSISGNMLAVVNFATFSEDTWNIQLYELNAAADGFIPSQDPIIVYDDVLSLELSLDYLVYWDRFQQNAVVYQRQNESAPYSIADRIFVKAPKENQIALHNDILIVGGDNQTHIYSENNGNWAEALILEQQYRYYEVSSRTLLATNAMSVFSFNFEKCTQEMPTQSPSLSLVPSSSFSPSLSLSPTSLPTVMSAA